jgi:hypothetical protein
LRAEKFYFSTGRKITSKNKDENNVNSGGKILKIGSNYNLLGGITKHYKNSSKWQTRQA